MRICLYGYQFAFASFVHHAGGWPEDAVEILDGDVVTRGADPKRDRGLAWTTSLSSRLRLFMAEPRGVSITLNGSEIVPISCEELLATLEEMPLFEDANRLLAQANESRSTGSAVGSQTEQEQKLSIDEPFASGRADPAIYESGTCLSAVGTAGCDAGKGYGGESVGASVMKTGRPAMIYRGTVREHRWSTFCPSLLADQSRVLPFTQALTLWFSRPLCA